MAINLRYATTAQLGTALRGRFKNASKEELYRLAAKIKKHYDLGEFTDAQMKNLFNLTTIQWNNLKAKIVNYAAAYDAMQNSAGE